VSRVGRVARPGAGAPGPFRRRLGRLARHSFTRFAVVGAVGYSFDVTLLLGLTTWGALPWSANVTIAFWVTYALNFVLNRRFAFHAEHTGDLRTQILRYLPQASVDYLLTLGGVKLFADELHLPLVEARLLAGGTNAVFNYTVYRWWTFRRTRPDGAADPTDGAADALDAVREPRGASTG